MSDLDIMKSSSQWPGLALPIKKGKNSDTEYAVLLGNSPEIFLVNIWDLPKENIESVKFNSFEEIIEAGWIVD